MSQLGNVAGERSAGPRISAAGGRAVALLAAAVLIGVALLHELDTTPKGASSSLLQAAKTETQTSTPSQAAAVPSTTSTLVARTPAEVKVLVANGVGVSGAASKVASRLQPIGYSLLKPGNTAQKTIASAVLYAPGYQAEAQGVATSLNIPTASVQAIPTPSPVADMQGANVLVIVGNDLASSTQGQTPTGSGTAQTNAQTSTGAQAGTGSQTQTNPLVGGPLSQQSLPGVSSGASSQSQSQSSTTIAGAAQAR